MPRRAREEIEGGVFHVYARGVEKRPIYRDDEDRRAYLRLLDEVIESTGWLCLSFCLMDNHVHLLVETPKANLAEGMRQLHGEYARAFNARYERSGHLFQSRYGAKRIKSQAQFWVVVAYIVNNPVEAGLCDRPEEWRWASHGSVLDGHSPSWLAERRLLEYFDVGGDPLAAYGRLTTELGVARPVPLGPGP